MRALLAAVLLTAAGCSLKPLCDCADAGCGPSTSCITPDLGAPDFAPADLAPVDAAAPAG